MLGYVTGLGVGAGWGLLAPRLPPLGLPVASDVVPHLAYGLGTAVTLRALAV